MSLFEWLVLSLLTLIAALAIVAICVSARAACNASDAKTEAEQERLLVKGTQLTLEQIQEAVEQVLYETGVLEALQPQPDRSAITTGDQPYHDRDRRQLVPTSQAGHLPEQPPPGHPLSGYQEVSFRHGPSRMREPRHTYDGHNGRVPAMAGAFQVAAPFGNHHDKPALRDARDPLGTHPVTDTLTSLPAVRDAGLADPEADVTELGKRWQRDAETTQGWSLAWPGRSGEQPCVDERPRQ